MVLTDTHCHFDSPDFDADRGAIMAACAERNVHRIMVPGVSAEQWPRLSALVGKRASDAPVELTYGLGLHPYFLPQHQNAHLADLDTRLRSPAVMAVGEIGLHGPAGDMARQVELLEAQLRLAQEHNLPVILHEHNAHNEMVRALKRVPPIGGVVHAFSGSYEMARVYERLGLALGIGGVITYLRGAKTRRAVQQLPLSSLVLETDAPDMPLCGFQGVRNTPSQLPNVFRALCRLRGNTDLPASAQVLEANACRVFGFRPKH